jgi:hypothetical protein
MDSYSLSRSEIIFDVVNSGARHEVVLIRSFSGGLMHEVTLNRFEKPEEVRKFEKGKL